MGDKLQTIDQKYLRTLQDTDRQFARSFGYSVNSYFLLVEEYWADPETKDIMATLYIACADGQVMHSDNSAVKQDLLARLCFKQYRQLRKPPEMKAFDLEQKASSSGNSSYPLALRDQFDVIDRIVSNYLDELSDDKANDVHAGDQVYDAWNDIKAATGYKPEATK